MNWDDYYMFMLDHLEKHFYSSGCGVRFLLDLFIFMEKKGRNCTEMSWKKNSGSEEKKTFLNSWKRQHFPGLEKNIMWVIREWRN